jgi:hypothetical protein
MFNLNFNLLSDCAEYMVFLIFVQTKLSPMSVAENEYVASVLIVFDSKTELIKTFDKVFLTPNG